MGGGKERERGREGWRGERREGGMDERREGGMEGGKERGGREGGGGRKEGRDIDQGIKILVQNLNRAMAWHQKNIKPFHGMEPGCFWYRTSSRHMAWNLV